MITQSYAEEVAIGLEILRGVLPFAPQEVTPEVAMVWARLLDEAGVEESLLRPTFERAGRTLERFPAPVEVIRIANAIRPPRVFTFLPELQAREGDVEAVGPERTPPAIPMFKPVDQPDPELEARRRSMIERARME